LVIAVVRATSLTSGELQNRGYQKSETPEPTVTKFGMDDYVGDIIPHAKIRIERPTADVPAKLAS